MKGLELKINDEAPIGVELHGVVSLIVMYHGGEATITVSGLQNDEEGKKERIVWLDHELIEDDILNIKLSGKLKSITDPLTVEAIDETNQNAMKLKNYYALKKELEENNMI